MLKWKRWCEGLYWDTTDRFCARKSAWDGCWILTDHKQNTTSGYNTLKECKTVAQYRVDHEEV